MKAISINGNQEESSILIVDDDPANLGVISASLEDHGFRMLVARDGESGLQKARYARPGLILLDVLMPGMDGFEICNRLKEDKSTRNIPVIFMTALTATKDKVRGFEAGGVDFITKPFQEDEVLARVRTHLSLRLMQRELKKNNDRLVAEIAERRQAEDNVRKLNEELEKRVEERTADLKAANLLLNKEVEGRKMAEKMVRESEERYRSLAKNVADGIMLVQANKLLFVNDAFLFMFGYSNENELIGKNVFNLISDEFRESYQKIIKQFEAIDNRNKDYGKSMEIFQGVCISKDGRKFWAEGHNTPIKWYGKSALLCTIRDINERKLNEIETQERADSLYKENVKLRSSIKDRFRFGDIIGKSSAMQNVYELIIRAASSDANVIIYGESGTGKELVAKAIHSMSRRSEKVFAPVNCQAIPEALLESSFFGHKKGAFTGAYMDKPGFLEKADGGVLFLDEVGDIGLGLQSKLLRAIEGGGYSPVGTNDIYHSDFRIIAATNKNMAEAVKNGTMREDFFYRIHIVPITLPPLRERKEDIPLLIDHFLSMFTKGEPRQVIPGKYMEALYNYHWPGNIRELQNALQRYLTIGNFDFLLRHQATPKISENTLGEKEIEFDSSSTDFRQKIASIEKVLLVEALNKSNWNRKKTTELLNIPRRTLYQKMKKYSLI
ncbi:MAG: sigma 54-interacting transcriptional regulator [Desulfobacterales bacterium]|jgi:PAS domain S-box-containing protein